MFNFASAITGAASKTNVINSFMAELLNNFFATPRRHEEHEVIHIFILLRGSSCLRHFVVILQLPLHYRIAQYGCGELAPNIHLACKYNLFSLFTSPSLCWYSSRQSKTSL